MKQLSPIQIFQNWLLDYEPAVGVVDYIHQRAAQNVRLISRVCKKFVSDISVAIPTIFFDPVFNAFHAKAVGHIFPLDTRHEKDNWWLTDKYLCSVVELKFRGQALLFIPVTVDNLLHRPYPQSRNRTTNAWREFIEDIQKKVPARYANHSLFRRFKEDPEKYLLTSRTYCLSVNRHQDIVPFAHFTRRLKRARVRFSAMIVLYLLISICIVSSLNFFFCVYCRLP